MFRREQRIARMFFIGVLNIIFLQQSSEGNIILNHGNLYIPLCQQVNVGN